MHWNTYSVCMSVEITKYKHQYKVRFVHTKNSPDPEFRNEIAQYKIPWVKFYQEREAKSPSESNLVHLVIDQIWINFIVEFPCLWVWYIFPVGHESYKKQLQLQLLGKSWNTEIAIEIFCSHSWVH